MANIDEFLYLSECNKLEFQGNITSLLEMQGMLSWRLAQASDYHKKGVFLTSGELEIIQKWLLDTTASLQENFAHVDRCNRILHKLYKAATRIHLKDIV